MGRKNFAVEFVKKKTEIKYNEGGLRGLRDVDVDVEVIKFNNFSFFFVKMLY